MMNYELLENGKRITGNDFSVNRSPLTVNRNIEIMKKIKTLLIMLAAGALLAACEKSDADGAKGTPLTLTGPTEKVVLQEAHANETAVTFTWNSGIERSPTDTITYIFRMDIAGKNFATATPRDTVTDFTKSFTADELNGLITDYWLLNPDEEIFLEARVVANVRGEKFVYPEIAVTSFTVTAYPYGPAPLYLTGPAAGGTPKSLTQLVSTRRYTWTGALDAGGFKFIYDPGNALPSLNMGANSYTMVERTDAGEPDDLFPITTPGFYAMNVNKGTMTINYKYLHYWFDHIYFVGDAIPAAAWDDTKAVEAPWNDERLAYVYEGPLLGDNVGEDAFKILTARAWGGYNIRPVIAWQPITDNRLEVREGGGDEKWKVKPEESGNYRVTVDLSAMTINFEKLN
jgi:hypothetical protein